jgi:predicted membrane-bound dolichyl-phosphate-mannose-protein mannosyltransferase
MLVHLAVAQADVTAAGWQLLGLILGTLLPLVVALVTTRWTSSRWQSVLLAALAALDGLLSTLWQTHQTGAPFDLLGAAVTALGAFVVGVATHYGLWKPTGASGALLDVGSRDQYDRAA